MAAGLQYSTGKNKTLSIASRAREGAKLWVVQAYPEGAQQCLRTCQRGLFEPLLADTLASLRSIALDCLGM